MLILLKRPITAVSSYLGHADVAVTMKIYAHFLKEKKQDTMSDLESRFKMGKQIPWSLEGMRRLGIAMGGVAAVAWIIFVMVASDGFARVEPRGWVIFR